MAHVPEIFRTVHVRIVDILTNMAAPQPVRVLFTHSSQQSLLVTDAPPERQILHLLLRSDFTALQLDRSVIVTAFS